MSDLRAGIVRLWEEGKKQSEIARDMNVPKQTVSDAIKRFRETAALSSLRPVSRNRLMASETVCFGTNRKGYDFSGTVFSLIQAHSLFFKIDDEKKEFKASKGWLQKFMDRHKLRARLPTTVCQKPPVEYEQAFVNFIIFVSQLREKTKYNHIYACDETAVWLDPTGGKCIDEKGEKEVGGCFRVDDFVFNESSLLNESDASIEC